MPETRSTAPVVSPKAPSKPAQKVAKPTEEAAKPALFQIGLEAINLSFVHFKKLIKIQFLKYGKTWTHPWKWKSVRFVDISTFLYEC